MQPSSYSQQAQVAQIPRSAAELRDAGVSRSITAGRKWQRVTHGYYRPSQQHTSSAQRILDASVSVPADGALAGWAAAFVCGVDWLDGYGLDGRQQLAVPICSGPDVHRRSPPGVRYVRDRLTGQERLRRHGLPVTGPSRTAFDTARWAGSLTESVVTLDALARFGLIRLAELDAYVAAHPGWAGVRQVRAALRMADAGVRSPWETRLRMAYVLEAGLPQPLVNPAVFDDRGSFVGMPDLLDAEAGLAVEYDGSGHRDRVQHNRDNAREEALEAVGLVVVRVDSYDYLFQRPRLVERLTTGHRRGRLRNRKLDRWTLRPPTWALDPYQDLTDEDKEVMFGHR